MTLTAVRLGGHPDRPLLVLGPSLGSSASALWGPAAAHLAEHFQILAWDLPGHGHHRLPLGQDPVTVASLAADVLAVVDDAAREYPASFHYAGDSVGGAVGLQLLLDAPERVHSATLLCTGARIGTPEGWRERAEEVTTQGTRSLASASADRWFGPGFPEREPERCSALLAALGEVSDEGYAAVCGALGSFDLRDRLAEIDAPVLAVAGAYDAAVPVSALADIARGVRHGRLEVLAEAAHLAPAEDPQRVAALITEHALGRAGAGDRGSATDRRHEAGGVLQREVLGERHLDRVSAETTDLTRDFQRLVTEYAWGEVWTRPGLDRRSRSIAVLTALVARGHHEELAAHLRGALRNDLTVPEIREVLLQAAIYCGVPAAGAAFRIAQEVLGE